VIVVDDPNREAEGDLIMATRFARPERMAQMLRLTTGIVCAPIAHADALGLPKMCNKTSAPTGRPLLTRRLAGRHHDGRQPDLWMCIRVYITLCKWVCIRVCIRVYISVLRCGGVAYL
jgi:hypothetical protein